MQEIYDQEVYTIVTIQVIRFTVQRFTVSRLTLFSIAIILCIAEYISLTETPEHREEISDYF